MQYSNRVYMVGSGKHGNQLTNRMDCSVYLLHGGNGEYALIDAGGGIEPERIVANIERCGVAMEQVKQLLLTHAHGDHAAGAKFFREQYGMITVAAEEAALWIETADPVATSIQAAIQAGTYPADYVYPPCPIDRRVNEGDQVQVGELILHVLETPGHSRGHISFLFEEEGQKALFSGDVVFAGGKVVLQNIWDCSIQDYAASVAKLSELSIDRLYPGHSAVLMSEAHEHIAIAHRAFEGLGLPTGL